jgi:hypothetical protein
MPYSDDALPVVLPNHEVDEVREVVDSVMIQSAFAIWKVSHDPIEAEVVAFAIRRVCDFAGVVVAKTFHLSESQVCNNFSGIGDISDQVFDMVVAATITAPRRPASQLAAATATARAITDVAYRIADRQSELSACPSWAAAKVAAMANAAVTQVGIRIAAVDNITGGIPRPHRGKLFT